MNWPLPTDSEVVWSKFIAYLMAGVPEFRLEDQTRVDILLPTAAVEVEWCKCWKSGIGQALHYAIHTNRQPVLMLLTRGKPREVEYIRSAMAACQRAGVTLLTWPTRRLS